MTEKVVRPRKLSVRTIVVISPKEFELATTWVDPRLLVRK